MLPEEVSHSYYSIISGHYESLNCLVDGANSPFSHPFFTDVFMRENVLGKFFLKIHRIINNALGFAVSYR